MLPQRSSLVEECTNPASLAVGLEKANNSCFPLTLTGIAVSAERLPSHRQSQTCSKRGLLAHERCNQQRNDRYAHLYSQNEKEARFAY